MNNLKTHYKSQFEIQKTATADERSIFQVIVGQVGSWLKEHYKKTGEQENIFKPWLFRGGNFDVADLCTQVRTMDYDENTRAAKYWNLRFEHNDENYAPRKWRVDVALTCINDNAGELAVSVYWYLVREAANEEPQEPDSAVPRLVKHILKSDALACYKSGIMLRSNAIKLNAGDEGELHEFLISEDRSIPVVLISKQNYGNDFSPDGVQNLLAGSALVYWSDCADVQTALSNEWKSGIRDFYQCPKDAIRIYLPCLDAETEYDWERHPSFSLEEYTGKPMELNRMLKKRIFV